MGIETVLLVAGAAISAGSAISAGRQAKATGEYQAQQAAADANAARESAKLEADQIRKAGQRQRASAVAAQAAAGVKMDTGTAEIINTEITQNAEQDALTTIQSGINRSRQINAGGQASKISGDNANRAGYLNAASTALGAGSSLARGWRTTSAKGD
jgi:hypothetical protein